MIDEHNLFKQLTPANEALLQFIAEGYTVGAIRRKFFAIFRTTKDPQFDLIQITDATIINYLRANRSLVEAGRKTLNEDIDLMYGMANAASRIRRLALVIDEIEPKALTDEKWMAQWRQLVAQVQRETEPFAKPMDPSDPWAALLNKLVDAAFDGKHQHRTEILDAGNPGTDESSTKPPSG